MTITPTIENRFYELYLQYFHKAEAHRRWNLAKDIPWHQARRHPDDAVAQIVESFMAVEMYLPDYTSKILHLIRRSRGRAWFQANWGYEESKHSLVLETWLVRSGHRTNEQLRGFEEEILARQWDLCYDSPLEMIVYTTFQEFATGLNYRNLRNLATAPGDAALDRMLVLLSQDETAHFQFFKEGVRISPSSPSVHCSGPFVERGPSIGRPRWSLSPRRWRRRSHRPSKSCWKLSVRPTSPFRHVESSVLSNSISRRRTADPRSSTTRS